MNAMALARTQILERLASLVANRLDIALPREGLGEDLGLLGQGIGLDSIEVLELVAAMEEEFDLTLYDDELDPQHFRTFGTLATLVQEKLP
jgi:acyl carrier protein